jgi:hypothetical protein
LLTVSEDSVYGRLVASTQAEYYGGGSIQQRRSSHLMIDRKQKKKEYRKRPEQGHTCSDLQLGHSLPFIKSNITNILNPSRD